MCSSLVVRREAPAFDAGVGGDQRSAVEAEPGETLISNFATPNDTHSQIDPLPANDGQYPDKGGVARRATLVKRIRQRKPQHAADRCG